MNKLTLILLISFFCLPAYSQTATIDHAKIEEDLNLMLVNLEKHYIYRQEKNIDLNCIKKHYTQEIKNIKSHTETVLLFEYLLDEFYDNHLTLTTNTKSSYRLFAPIYAKLENDKPIIANMWQTQIENLSQEIIGAEIKKFNGIDFDQVIQNFPTHCQNKGQLEIREWITNKILAGRYNEPRILTLNLLNGNEIEFDLDNIQLKENNGLLTSKTVNEIGVIRINDSLGMDELVNAFDNTLSDLSETKGLIIDLRNTVFGGDTYEARGILSRFIKAPKPYQKHSFLEKSINNPDVERIWIEYVSPRLEQYEKPVIVLVGRWTGSMGEGLAIGFEGMERGVVMGSEMRRLAGEVFDFRFKHLNFGYKLSTIKLHHVNGTSREKYVPTHYVKQTTIHKDEAFEKAINMISKMNH